MAATLSWELVRFLPPRLTVSPHPGKQEAHERCTQAAPSPARKMALQTFIVCRKHEEGMVL